MNYFKEYEKLYQKGYHERASFSGPEFIKEVFDLVSFDTVLDVGCSWGSLVNYCIKRRKYAEGIDVSRIAVRVALAAGLPCKVASALKIPYKDESFHMIFSTDVVEHIEEHDIAKLFSELLRVSNNYVAVRIACGRTKNRWTEIELHQTQWSPYIWAEKIAAMPVKVLHYKAEKGHVEYLLEKA